MRNRRRSATERPDEKASFERTRMRALQRAIKILSYRSRTHFELAEGMRRRGFPEEITEDVIAELEERGLLDDPRLASDIVSGGQRAGKSRSRIYAELRRRGIKREDAEGSMQECFDAEKEREAAARLLQRSLPCPLASAGKNEIEKAARRLAGRGFSASAIADVLGDTHYGDLG